MKIRFIFFIATSIFSQTIWANIGFLVLSHGTMDMRTKENSCHVDKPSEWENSILESVERIKKKVNAPVEVAFGMWNTFCYEKGVQNLEKQLQLLGQTLDHLVVLPLFISSYSSVVEMQKFIFKVRPDKVLPIPDVNPISFEGKISYLKAIDYDPYVSQLLGRRVQRLVQIAIDQNKDINNLNLVLVMHGPVAPEDNIRWLEMGEAYINSIKASGLIRKSFVVSLQDDADRETRERATLELRDKIQKIKFEGGTSLILPLLLAKGGIESGILERIKGLSYIWSGEMLFPDPLLENYILSRLSKVEFSSF